MGQQFSWAQLGDSSAGLTWWQSLVACLGLDELPKRVGLLVLALRWDCLSMRSLILQKDRPGFFPWQSQGSDRMEGQGEWKLQSLWGPGLRTPTKSPLPYSVGHSTLQDQFAFKGVEK